MEIKILKRVVSVCFMLYLLEGVFLLNAVDGPQVSRPPSNGRGLLVSPPSPWSGHHLVSGGKAKEVLAVPQHQQIRL